MEQGLRLLEESISNSGNSEGAFSRVICRDYKPSDYVPLMIMMDDFCRLVHKKDFNITTPEGFNLLECEYQKFVMDQSLCWVMESGNKVVGYVIFNLIYDCIVAVRGMYFSREYRNNGLLEMFLDRGIARGFKKFYYQTYKAHGYNGNDIKVSENDEMITWEIKNGIL